MTTIPLLVYLTLLTLVVGKLAHGQSTGYRGHPAIAVCTVFGRAHCLEALKVVDCESGFSVRARNGQYRGLFQMGYLERRRYGDGEDAWSQAKAAKRYFVASGRDWSPWSCRP